MRVPDSAPSFRKRPFDIGQVVRRIRREVAQYAGAAMFDVTSPGYSTVFQQLI